MAGSGADLRSKGNAELNKINTCVPASRIKWETMKITIVPTKFWLLAFFAAMIIMAPRPALALLEIDITQGNMDPIAVAVPEFYAARPGERQMGYDLAEVIAADLRRSGLFRPIDRQAYVQSSAAIQLQPRFQDWRLINALALISGKVEMQGDGRMRIEFRLWDVYSEQQMSGMAFQTTGSNWRSVAHLIADVVYQRLTGESGYFDTRIVYVAESGPALNRRKRLAIMDQDGTHIRYLTSGDELVLTPRFSPTSQEITYLSYFNDKPRVYLLDIETGQQEVLGDFPGMTFAPRFSPDGTRVILVLAQDGNSDIFTMDLRTRVIERLTTNPAIDTSPSYSPDSRFITYNSDRGGSQQLYVMNADGSGSHRISFGQGRYGTPVWSPRGDLIAFTKIANGRFFIGIMRPDGTGERLLTESYRDEGPTWAPNGRVLMFFRQTPYDDNGGGGESSLWSIDLTGYNEIRAMTPGAASDPAWSPLIHGQ